MFLRSVGGRQGPRQRRGGAGGARVASPCTAALPVHRHAHLRPHPRYAHALGAAGGNVVWNILKTLES